jgi:GT2 family glycosyltransferase
MENLLNIFRNINEYLQKGLRIVRQRGINAAFQNFQVKVPSGSLQENTSLSVKDWLVYYEHRAEIAQPLNNYINDKFPKVSILILAFNNLVISQLCLRSIYCNTTYPNFEVIVVDNASTDETPAWLKNYSRTHPNLKLILNSDNLGFAGGNNQASREAAGEYLIFLNNDTVVTQGWIERLLAPFQSDPGIGLVGPVTNATGNEALIPFSYTTPAEMEAFAHDRAIVMSMRSFDIRMLAFYCVMARKDQFESLGGLDERYSVGMFEDDDLAVRYHQQGLKVVCAEDVFIHHFQRMSFSKIDIETYNRIFEENRKKYEEKWGRKWEPYQLRQDTSSPHPVGIDLTLQKPWGTLKYRCNICGRACKTPVVDLGREKPSCECSSTVRSRSIVHLLSKELFGRSLALPDFPVRPDLHGWGMSDAGYSDLLLKKIGYTNTFYHQEPRFDISAPLDPSLEGTLDFLISTEVFEHIAPPVSRSFENARRLLKPTGVFIFTVPYTLNPSTSEHFPDLHDYEVINRTGANPILKNITHDGREQVFDNLVFHGGSGATLEMRVFSKTGLMAELEQAGFVNIRICSEPCWEFGIYWQDPWSLPIAAR